MQIGNKVYTYVDRYLIRGPHPSYSEVFKLKEKGITQIYDFRQKGIRGFKFLERLACKRAGVKYIYKPYSFLRGDLPQIADYENIAKSVVENGKNGGKTLFHCNSGRHRTAHMSTFYALTKGEPLKQVIKENALGYKDMVTHYIDKHILKKDYFNRKMEINFTLNPIKLIKNLRNNQVLRATTKALEDFKNQLLNG